MIRVVIADDQALVRGGLRLILDAQEDITVVGEAGDGGEVIRLVDDLDPDLVLMDVEMPGLDGIAATRRLLQRPKRAPKVLVLTAFDLDEYVYEAIRAGASGFLRKTAPPQQLADGVRGVMAGDALLAPAVTRRLLDRFIQRAPPGSGRPSELADLSERELDVLRLTAEGHSNAEIAQCLVDPRSEILCRMAASRLCSQRGNRRAALFPSWSGAANQLPADANTYYLRRRVLPLFGSRLIREIASRASRLG